MSYQQQNFTNGISAPSPKKSTVQQPLNFQASPSPNGINNKPQQQQTPEPHNSFRLPGIQESCQNTMEGISTFNQSPIQNQVLASHPQAPNQQQQMQPQTPTLDRLLSESSHHNEDTLMGQKKTLDHMVRIEVGLPSEKETQAMVDTSKACVLVSYFGEYHEYLDENNLVDPEVAKANEQKAKLRKEQAAEKQQAQQQREQKQIAEAKAAAVASGDLNAAAMLPPPQIKGRALPEGEDLEDEDQSDAKGTQGLHRYDQMLKSMLARLEVFNSLAPKQDYGRHQTKNTRAKKVKPASTADPSEKGQETKEKPIDLDDKFYDLDDDFIDDDDLEEQNEDILGTDLMLAEDNRLDRMKEAGSKESQTTAQQDIEDERENKRQIKETESIIDRFQVILPDQVHKQLDMQATGHYSVQQMEQWNNPVPQEYSLGNTNGTMKDTEEGRNSNNQQKDGQNKNGLQYLKPNTDPTGTSSATGNGNGQNSASKILPKQRSHEEAFGGKVDEASIEAILQDLKERVLRSETLNSFKRQITRLVELIEQKDQKMENLVFVVGSKLALILQKPEQEMQHMLKRIHLLNKKNIKKQELDRTLSLIKAKIEAILRQQNKRSEFDYLELSDLNANTFVFRPADDLKLAAARYPKDLKEFVRGHNEYIKTKVMEEKAKAKRPAGKLEALNNKYEQLDFDKELAKNIREVLVNQLPENIRHRMSEKHLNILFGLSPEPPENLPFAGNSYNKVLAFPVQAQTGVPRRI